MTVVTERTASVNYVCAYCGEMALYRVMTLDGTLSGYCCAEPTHFTWLHDAVRAEEAKGPKLS